MFQAQEIQISVRLECTLNVRFLRLEYTVHETRKYGIQQKKPLKLCPTALFTYLKIISLQHFQFLVINGIQTDP